MRRFVSKLRVEAPREAHPVIVTAPGEEAHVDYGDGPMVRHPETGKYRRTRLFVPTLGYSRKSVRLLTWKSSSRVWAELHERAFRRLGGAVRVILLDNLKEGVLEPDVYDPTLNPLYRDVLAHYGVTALPCSIASSTTATSSSADPGAGGPAKPRACRRRPLRGRKASSWASPMAGYETSTYGRF